MKIAKRTLFLVLIPVYIPIMLFLQFTEKWWEGLLE